MACHRSILEGQAEAVQRDPEHEFKEQKRSEEAIAWNIPSPYCESNQLLKRTFRLN
jgi:hypothetical protein